MDYQKMQAFFDSSSLVHALTASVGSPPVEQVEPTLNLPPASFLNAAALTSLRREKTDVHAASFFRFEFYSVRKRTELCEAPISYNKTSSLFDCMKKTSPKWDSFEGVNKVDTLSQKCLHF